MKCSFYVLWKYIVSTAKYFKCITMGKFYRWTQTHKYINILTINSVTILP